MTDDARIAEIRARLAAYDEASSRLVGPLTPREHERASDAIDDALENAPADIEHLLDRLDAALRENGALRDTMEEAANYLESNELFLYADADHAVKSIKMAAAVLRRALATEEPR